MTPKAGFILEKSARHAGEDADVYFLTDLKGVNEHEVNAFQAASQVVLQMSTREGFGLTVAEALWKGVPVVGRRVGGIPLQIIDGENGYLVDTVEQAAEKTMFLLNNPEIAKQMGAKGKEHVRENFLIISQLRDNLRLYDAVVNKDKKKGVVSP